MSTIIPATLALLGLGMFACSFWLQVREERWRNRREPVPVMVPASGAEEEESEVAALTQYPLVPR